MSAPSPSDPSGPAPSDPAARPAPGYTGPPLSTPPPADWRPEVVIEPPPPRRLPPQDHLAIDEAEGRARTFTRGFSLLASAALLVLALVLCGQRLF